MGSAFSVHTGQGSDGAGVGRSTAIPAIGTAPWGTHFCQFFSGRQDLIDVLVPFIRSGLEGNERCIWRTCPPLDTADAIESLAREIDAERAIATGQLTISSSVGWYGYTGPIKRDEVLCNVIPRVSDALAQGYDGVRIAGDMSWLEDRAWDAYMDYEDGLNQVMPGHRVLGVCTYSLQRCDALSMLDVVSRHQFALVKRGEWTLIEPSERKRATAAVEQMNRALAQRTEELQAALTDLRGFSRWLTHDLRAPLRAVRSFSEILAEDWDSQPTADGRHALSRIQTAADLMDHLITDILGYSTAQQQDLHRRPVDVEALVRDIWPMLTAPLVGRRVELTLQPLPPAYADPVLLRQVLTNLIGNAVKFTRVNANGHIELGVTDVNREVAYYVRDDGAGFDPRHADRVFAAFERLHSRAEFEGTGLGLTIVKEIISRHGGRVWATGAPGKGATFTFTLPDPDHPQPAAR